MGRRLALLPALVALLTTPMGAYALGLGNIKMRSALDQPLEAEIDLQVSRSAELEGLQVMLASDQMFRSSTVERIPFLSNLRFSIAKKGDGTPYIRVSSSQPVREPFLNFLVEASWSSGRAVRQYTVLVDPPTTTQEAAPTVDAPKAVASRAPAVVSAPRPSAPARPEAVAPMARNGELVSRMTRRNDTLWIIANEVRPSRSVTTQQVMVALQRENPEAFQNNNMNRLKAGYVLRLKDAKSIAVMSSAQADAEVDRQYAEWKGKPAVKTPAKPVEKAASVKGTVPKKEAAKPAAAAAGAPEAGKPQLKLLGATAAGTGGESAKGKTGDLGKLQQDVALANENLVAHQKETEEMHKRIAALETQIANMQKAISVKDQQLASLQGKSESAPAAEEDALQNPLVLGALGLGVIILGAFGWLFMQRRRAGEAQESILSPPEMMAAPAAPAVAPVVAAAAATSAAIAAAEEKSAGTDSSFLTDFSISSMEGIQTDVGEIDPMSEADVYLAYGRYNQAEEIMSQAIANDPSRHDYRLKMCEIHYAAKDPQRFVRAAEGMRDALGGATGPMWDRVATMGRDLCPDSFMFSAGARQPAAPAASMEDTVIGGGLMGDVAQAAQAGEESAPASEQSDFDEFHAAVADLGGAMKFGEEPFAAEEPSAAKGAEDNLMEFDVPDWMSKTALPESSVEREAAEKAAQDIAANTLDFDIPSFVKQPVEEPEIEIPTALEEPSAPKGGELDDEFFKGLDIDFRETPTTPSQGAGSLEAIDFAELTGKAEPEVGFGEDLGELPDDHLFANIDEVGTKLDLARAYIDMGDADGARSLLDEIMEEGSDTQRHEAQELINKLG